jgi:hypothetical protein
LWDKKAIAVGTDEELNEKVQKMQSVRLLDETNFFVF